MGRAPHTFFRLLSSSVETISLGMALPRVSWLPPTNQENVPQVCTQTNLFAVPSSQMTLAWVRVTEN